MTTPTQCNNSFELFIPERIMERNIMQIGNWCNERGSLYYWRAFNPKANYPMGIKNTPWDNIVWSYRIYFS